MPLHLLGKKSWNVYNADNIARVRRDEAAAKAAEEAEEQRMQEIDAQRRLAILRGEAPPPLLDEDAVAPEDGDSGRRPTYAGGTRKRKKRADEDDTDFELRLAKEKNDAIHGAIEASKKSTISAPIVDHTGLIDLFGDERTRAHAEKNEEMEAEAKEKQREYEDQYTMRFSKAAGKDGTIKPWYSQSDGVVPDSSSKDVWGNDDPNRRQRDTQRIVSNDPLAMMRKAVSQVRDLKKERKRMQEERDEELRQLRKDRHRDRRHRREDRDDEHLNSDSRRRESRKQRLEERSRDRRDDHRERRRHKEDERRRRHRSRSRSRSQSPRRRLHHHRDRDSR